MVNFFQYFAHFLFCVNSEVLLINFSQLLAFNAPIVIYIDLSENLGKFLTFILSNFLQREVTFDDGYEVVASLSEK
jgi:membrane protein YqaA with SNARE-associated domain